MNATHTTKSEKSSVVAEKVKGKPKTTKLNGHAPEGSDFPLTPDLLPKTGLTNWKLAAAITATIKDGVSDAEHAGVISMLISTLTNKEMTPAQVASVLWNIDHGISKQVRAAGYGQLCATITKTLGERDQTRKERDEEFFRRYVHVEKACVYWDRDESQLIERQTLNDRYIGAFGEGMSAHSYWHLNRARYKGALVADVTYWPGKDAVVMFKGMACINRWQPARVQFTVDATDDDVERWLSLARRLIPETEVREHFFDMAAFMIQNPGKKINHHFLFGGDPGIGKDTLLEPLLYGIGGGIPEKKGEPPADRINVSQATTETLEDGWGYHLLAQLICIQELKEIYAGERRKLANKLKVLQTIPPFDVTVNIKKEHKFNIPNVMNLIATTNFFDAISIDKKDRRWFAYWSYAKPMKAEDRQSIWSWYQKGGVTDVAGWLKVRDLSAFDAHAPAPGTTFKQTLIETGRNDTEAGFHRIVTQRLGLLKYDLVSPEELADDINEDVKRGADRHVDGASVFSKRVVPGQVSAALCGYRWKRIDRLDAFINKQRYQMTLLAAPETARKYEAMRNDKGGHAKVIKAYLNKTVTAPEKDRK